MSISLGGDEHPLGADDLLITMKPLEGYRVEREGSHAVALEVEIDESLRVEGWARDIVRAVQNARQAAGLEVTDRIVLTLDGDERARRRGPRLREPTSPGETLATQVSYEALNGVEPVTIDDRLLKIGVASPRRRQPAAAVAALGRRSRAC